MTQAEVACQDKSSSSVHEPFAVMVLLDGIPCEVGDRVLAAANEVLRPAGLFLVGPCPLTEPLSPSADDRGKALIDALAQLRPARRIIALTGRVLTDARGRVIDGEAQLGGRIAAVSIARDSQEPDRAASRVAHEAGHLRGRRHCGALGCAMNPWALPCRPGTLPSFCDSCRLLLASSPG